MDISMITCGSCGDQMPASVWSCPNCGDLNPDAEAHEFLYLTDEQVSNQPYFSTPMEPGPFSTPMRPWSLNAGPGTDDDGVASNEESAHSPTHEPRSQKP